MKNWSNIYVNNYYTALHLMYRALFLIELEFKNTYIYIYIYIYISIALPPELKSFLLYCWSKLRADWTLTVYFAHHRRVSGRLQLIVTDPSPLLSWQGLDASRVIETRRRRRHSWWDGCVDIWRLYMQNLTTILDLDEDIETQQSVTEDYAIRDVRW